VDIAVADQVGSLLADAMVEAFRDVLPNGPTRLLAIPGVGPTWTAAKADGEMREKALRQAVDQSTASSRGAEMPTPAPQKKSRR
jgi:hypothetical protein